MNEQEQKIIIIERDYLRGEVARLRAGFERIRRECPADGIKSAWAIATEVLYDEGDSLDAHFAMLDALGIEPVSDEETMQFLMDGETPEKQNDIKKLFNFLDESGVNPASDDDLDESLNKK